MSECRRRIIRSLRTVNNIVRANDCASRGQDFTAGQAQQCRLAGPVRPDDSTPARRELDRKILEKSFSTRLVPEADLIEGKTMQGHGISTALFRSGSN